jgi:hypothetical protein
MHSGALSRLQDVFAILNIVQAYIGFYWLFGYSYLVFMISIKNKLSKISKLNSLAMFIIFKLIAYLY